MLCSVKKSRKGGKGGDCLMGTEFQLGKMESSGDGWWEWLHDSAKVLHATDLYT